MFYNVLDNKYFFSLYFAIYHKVELLINYSLRLPSKVLHKIRLQMNVNAGLLTLFKLKLPSSFYRCYCVHLGSQAVPDFLDRRRDFTGVDDEIVASQLGRPRVDVTR